MMRPPTSRLSEGTFRPSSSARSSSRLSADNSHNKENKTQVQRNYLRKSTSSISVPKPSATKSAATDRSTTTVAKPKHEFGLDAVLAVKITCRKYDFKERIEAQGDLIKKFKEVALKINARREELTAEWEEVIARKEEADYRQQEEITELSTQTEAAAAEQKEQSHKAMAMEAELKALASAHAKLVEATAVVERELAAATTARLTATRELSTLQQQASEAQARTEAQKHEELAAKQQQITESEEHEQAMEAVQMELEATEARIAEDNDSWKRHEAAVAALKQLEGDLQATIDALKSSNAQCQVEKDKVAQQIQRAEDQFAEAKSRVVVVEERLAQKEQHIHESLQSFTHAQHLHESRLDELRQERDAAVEKEKSLRTQASELSDSLMSLSEECGNRGGQVASLQQAVEEASLQREEAQKKHDVTAQQLGQAETTLRVLKEAHSDVTTKFETYQKNSGMSREAQLEEMRNLRAANVSLNNALVEWQQKMANSSGEVGGLREKVQALRDAQNKAEATRRRLHNDIQNLRGTLRVIARLRPTIPGEAASVVTLHRDSTVVEVPSSTGTDACTVHRAFGAHSSQEDVYSEVSPSVQSAIDGHSVCVLAIGPARSGKSFTLVGDESAVGIIPKALQQLSSAVDMMKKKSWTYNVTVVSLGVSGETIIDLASQKSMSASDLSSATWKPLSETEDVLSALRQTNGGHSLCWVKISASNPHCSAHLESSLVFGELRGDLRDSSSDLASVGALVLNLAGKPEQKPVVSGGSALATLLEPCMTKTGKLVLLATATVAEGITGHSALRFGNQVHNVVAAKAGLGPAQGKRATTAGSEGALKKMKK